MFPSTFQLNFSNNTVILPFSFHSRSNGPHFSAPAISFRFVYLIVSDIAPSHPRSKKITTMISQQKPFQSSSQPGLGPRFSSEKMVLFWHWRSKPFSNFIVFPDWVFQEDARINPSQQATKSRGELAFLNLSRFDLLDGLRLEIIYVNFVKARHSTRP